MQSSIPEGFSSKTMVERTTMKHHHEISQNPSNSVSIGVCSHCKNTHYMLMLAFEDSITSNFRKFTDTEFVEGNIAFSAC